MKVTKLFNEFFESEKAGGIVLIICTVVSLLLANSVFSESYHNLWHYSLGDHSIEHWVNDGLMTIFFLLIGLELERELYIGELSNLKKASLPIIAAIGGMIVPAGIYLFFNYNTATKAGAGIPMATDIAFAIGILSLLGNRVPLSMKIFLTALAVIDDLGAIMVIALFYTKDLVWANFFISMGIFGFLCLLNRLKVYILLPYLIGGVAMWYFMLHSGIHATITGVLLAFAIPFSDGKEGSISYSLQHFLHKPVAFFILPLFALANTAIPIASNWAENLTHSSSIGIIAGLVLGKPLGIFILCFVAVSIGLSSLPHGVKWKQIFGLGLLGGIGFTMSIFITLLAFEQQAVIDSSKIAIMLGSFVAGAVGFVWLKITLKAEKNL